MEIILFQGYSGRRSYGGNGGPRGSKGETANIWEVVSALANALQDARNQLVNLMNTSRGSPMRLHGGRTNSYETCESRLSCTPRAVSLGRTYSPYAGVRNVHRGHAHGHVAFGSNSEFPLHATPSRARPRPVYVQMSARQLAAREAASPAAAGRRCTHPLHGMGAAARSLTPRRVQTNWPSSQMADCRKSHCDQLSRRDRACVNISSGKNHAGGKNGTTRSDHRRHDHCLGTQFISLLKQEAHQIRERRLAEESLRDRRPSWSRC